MMGPSQPEFTSYEAPGATDMVDLSTGDFSYSLPVIDIPGPERSFSLPLIYKAGIQLEQEASWVGLGWSLNPGAIARSVNGYADDANNEQVQTTFNKSIDRGWAGGLPGVLDLGWNSISGHSGTVSLLGLSASGSWDNNGINSVNVIGIVYKGGSISADPAQIASSVLTIASMGVSGAALGNNVGLQLGNSLSMGVVMGAAGIGRMGGVAGFNNLPTREVERHTFYDNYWNYYNNNTTENAYGSLYFGKMSSNTFADPNPQDYTNKSQGPDIYNSSSVTSPRKAPLFKYKRTVGKTGNYVYETAADVYQDGTNRIDPIRAVKTTTIDGTYYKDSGRRSISIAHDYFNVMGEGISGAIRPYRLEVGSVAYPKLGVNTNDANVINHYKHMVVPFLDDYKVGFRYENSLSNGYTAHRYTPPTNSQAAGFTIDPTNGALTITDPALFSSRTGSPRKGLYNSSIATNQTNRRFVQGKEVTWYSNSEIIKLYGSSSNGADNGFLEFEHPTATGGIEYGANNPFRKNLPSNGIGAFAVTAEDGTTYHYSLPVYHYQTYSESNEVQTSQTIGGLGKSTRRVGQPLGSDWTGTASTNPSGAYATTWLLTAITSADYIDRNKSGTVDAEDWGGWVKFEYGKFSAQYKWRQPYIGNSYSDDTTIINNTAFTEGYRQTYYLNTIATRSHTALFVKSVRQDGRGHFRSGVTATSSNLGIDERSPASALRLDEIILLDNTTLNKLRTADAIRTSNDPTPVPALTNATSAQFGPYSDSPMNGSGDDINSVLDVHDLDGDSRIRQFVEANALKRIRFNYGYDLCRGAPNSFSCISNDLTSLPPMDEANISTNRGGKLTLKSVSFFGPTVNKTVTKITPDFVFGYEKAQLGVEATNPSYGKERWDAFGMYLASGKFDVISHKPQRGDYPAPWNLTQITTPLGGVTEIAYERDEYAHVSEFGTTKVHLRSGNCSPTFQVSYDNPLGGSLTSVLKANQYIYLTGSAKYSAGPQGSPSSQAYSPGTILNKQYLHSPFTVTAVANSEITLSPNPSPSLEKGYPCQYESSTYDIVVPVNVVGGDIRVASLTTKEGNSSYQVRYKYTNPASSTSDESWFNSSGVLAQEPSFLNRFDHPVYGTFDYPTTPVLYGRVSVLRGLFRGNSDDDYDTREVYSFFTPSTNMITDKAPQWSIVTNSSSAIPVAVADNQTTVDVGKIGRPQKIEIYNKRGEQEISTSFTYASTIANPDGLANQGHYTEGVLNNERVQGEYRINRSTKEYVPAIMVGSRNTRNGVTSTTNNVLYDFYTGQVLETAFTNSLGKTYHSRTVPAYTLPGNEGMGAKGDNPANKHMLAQQGAAYTYVEVPGGPAYDPLNFLNPQTVHVLSAGVQTWQQTWNNYREANTTGAYQDVAGQVPVWRQAAAYVWKSPDLALDGSFKNFVPFVWSGTQDARWLKAGENVRYDHYSHALESRNVNGSYTTQKTGYKQTQLIAAATNARYTELAYSGAEDQQVVSGATHFGGEVLAGGTPDPDKLLAHTGFYSNKLTLNQKGFIYRAQAGRDIDLNKTYRVSAWVNTNGPNGKLYAEQNGTRIAEVSRSSATTKKAGPWYLLSLLVKVPATANGQVIEFGCVNEGEFPANFDDFRVAPLTATVASRVYDPRTNNLLYSLDNDNLFTHYEYTTTGRLKKIYRETLDRPGDNSLTEKVVKEYDFNYARFLFPTWVTTAYRCQTDAQGNNTGYEERLVTDVNPLNNPPASSKWELNSKPSFATCMNCPPSGTVLSSGCDAQSQQDGSTVYYSYNVVADGNCGVYVDYGGMSNSGCY